MFKKGDIVSVKPDQYYFDTRRATHLARAVDDPMDEGDVFSFHVRTLDFKTHDTLDISCALVTDAELIALFEAAEQARRELIEYISQMPAPPLLT